MTPLRKCLKGGGCESFGRCSGFGDGAIHASARRKSLRLVLGLTLMLKTANAWPANNLIPRATDPSLTTAPPVRFLQQRFQRGNAAALRNVQKEKSSMRMKATGRDRGRPGAEKEEALWLGLDLSTQSLTAAVLRGDGVGGASNEPVVLESVNYEVRVPLYFRNQQLA